MIKNNTIQYSSSSPIINYTKILLFIRLFSRRPTRPPTKTRGRRSRLLRCHPHNLTCGDVENQKQVKL